MCIDSDVISFFTDYFEKRAFIIARFFFSTQNLLSVLARLKTVLVVFGMFHCLSHDLSMY